MILIDKIDCPVQECGGKMRASKTRDSNIRYKCGKCGFSLVGVRV